MSRSTSVVIIGAGPYGLSLAAHLHARGIGFRIFGSAMHSWRTQMPQGMLLKSEGDASNLYDPDGAFTLARFCRERGTPYRDSGQPVGLDTFCEYGLEFQKRFVPELEDRRVTRVTRAADEFELLLDDGQVLSAAHVVVAVGVGYFSHVPRCLRSLPAELLSHSSAYGDLSVLHGRDVVVIGGGASALDIAALLHGAGQAVKLMVREPAVEIHLGPPEKPRSLWQRLRHPRSGIGNSLRSLLLARMPLAFHYLPESLRLSVTRRHLGPAGGWFVRDQVMGKVPMMLGFSLKKAELTEGQVRLECVSPAGEHLEITADHVIAATGYRVDLRRIEFLDEGLRNGLRAVENTPILSSRFESSTRGLYFIGPTAANSFGSVMRFAYGAGFTARRLAAHLGRVAKPAARPDTAVAPAAGLH